MGMNLYWGTYDLDLFILFHQYLEKSNLNQLSLDIFLENLNNYMLLDKDNNILIPSDFSYKCSMDIISGESEFLLALNEIQANNLPGYPSLLYPKAKVKIKK